MKIEDIDFKVDNGNLRGKFFSPDKPNGVAVLFLHGWTGKPNENAAKKIAENGFTAMTISLRGHNESDGKIEEITREMSTKDVLAAYDFLKSKLDDTYKIIVTGNSYGGYLALLLSTMRPVAALQLRVPANYVDDYADQPQMGRGADDAEVMKWRYLKLDHNATRALRAMHEYSGPVQIIEAENDERIPHQAVQNYIDAMADKTKLDYHFMPGWTHSLGDDRARNEQYQQLLLDWLNKQL
jgi:esterase/lipase